ncbi:hypothetical protein RYA05_04450 [Pseudomonas syringae pv. actinidiae]|nr:hypothetical protein [Pseudomonas syringae pv. actinidiae]
MNEGPGKQSIMALTSAVAQLTQLLTDAAKPEADVRSCKDDMQAILKRFSKSEIEGLAKIIAGQQTFLPGYPDTVVMMERK